MCVRVIEKVLEINLTGLFRELRNPFLINFMGAYHFNSNSKED